MENQIERDVYVTRETAKNPISYVQKTNMLPIIFHFRDYDIPSNASAMVFVEKPSGKAVYDNVEISGNDVTVTVTNQMFAEPGFSALQIQISQNVQNLVTFDQPVIVKKNRTDPDADQSRNESSFFDELQEAAQKANDAADRANDAAAELTPEAIQNAVNNFLTENPVTVDAVPELNGTALDFPDGVLMSGTSNSEEV